MFGEIQKLTVSKLNDATSEIKDVMSLICGDAKVAFCRNIKKLYRPHRYSGKDVMPSHCAHEAAGLKKDCVDFLQRYIDEAVEQFASTTDGLSDWYSEAKSKVASVLSSGFREVERRRRMNGNIREILHLHIEFQIDVGFCACLFGLLFFPLTLAVWLFDMLRWGVKNFGPDEFSGLDVAAIPITCFRTANSSKNASIREYARDEAGEVLDQVVRVVCA